LEGIRKLACSVFSFFIPEIKESLRASPNRFSKQEIHLGLFTWEKTPWQGGPKYGRTEEICFLGFCQTELIIDRLIAAWGIDKRLK
jgi:hypothetical protein